MPTPRRAAFMNTNIAFRPLCGWPIRVPIAPSRFIWQVALPWMPIFSSIAPQVMPLRVPIEPSGFGRNFGTRNSEMPLLPSGASGRRASTRCTMFSDMSCSPAEMKIFEPVIL